MKVREVIALVEADGWVLVRTRGNHRQYTYPTKPGLVTIAGNRNRDVPPRHTCEHSPIGRDQDESMRYAVIIEKGDTSYGASVPDLPGCIAVGETLDEV